MDEFRLTGDWGGYLPLGELAEGGGEGYEAALLLLLLRETLRLMSEDVAGAPELLRYGLVFDSLLPGGDCGADGFIGATVAPGRNEVPGPSSSEGSGALRGSRRYLVALLKQEISARLLY